MRSEQRGKARPVKEMAGGDDFTLSYATRYIYNNTHTHIRTHAIIHIEAGTYTNHELHRRFQARRMGGWADDNDLSILHYFTFHTH